MKKLILLIFFPIITFGQFSISTHNNYSEINYYEEGVLFAVEKIENGIITSNFIIKENDDWSFSVLSNEEYIKSQIKSKEFENALKNFYQDCNIIMKSEFYFKSVGNVFMAAYSYKENNISLVNTIFQFIKNDKLYTASGSSLRNSYREHFNDYKSMIDSVIFKN